MTCVNSCARCRSLTFYYDNSRFVIHLLRIYMLLQWLTFHPVCLRSSFFLSECKYFKWIHALVSVPELPPTPTSFVIFRMSVHFLILAFDILFSSDPLSGPVVPTVWRPAPPHYRVHQRSCHVCPQALRQDQPWEGESEHRWAKEWSVKDGCVVSYT